MTRRRARWTFASFVTAAVLGPAALGVIAAASQGSSTTVPAAGAASIVAGTAGAGGSTACSFSDPCSPAAVQPDSVQRVRLGVPASPNPDSCWYCLLHGTADAYTPWYVGVDYASPVATLGVTGGQTPEPVLEETPSTAAPVLLRDGYDLGYTGRLTGIVCVAMPGCASVFRTPVNPAVSRMSMSDATTPKSAERWEIVPIVAEREDAHTDNTWYRFGEKRSSTVQKVLLGYVGVVYS